MKKRMKVEQIIGKFREAELLISQATDGSSWPTRRSTLLSRRIIGGVKSTEACEPDQAKRFKELEQENARLKRLLADAELDKAILREAASGNF